jgi:orotidine-5'-phosphate decarboxylase
MEEKLIVALDVSSLEEAKRLLDELKGLVKIFKVGSRLFTAYGPPAVKLVQDMGGKVFLDLKFHDIPSTVAMACEAAADLEVDFLTLHTLGGFGMMETAITTLYQREKRPKLLGVTILTSLNEAFLQDVMGTSRRSLEEEVLHLAHFAKSAGLDGVISSPEEVTTIRKELGKDFLIVTPGIRPSDSYTGQEDQVRTTTPREALEKGVDHLVIGRPIIQSKNPRDAALSVLKEMDEVVNDESE